MATSFLGRLFRTTPVGGAARKDDAGLKRVLHGRDLIAIGLGTMIGGGIFTTIGPGVHKAGPAIIIAFMLAGLASLCAAFCYAELGSMVPNAGSAYTYAYATLGQLVAWIIGWDLLLEYAISVAPVAQQFSQSFQEALHALTGFSFPPWMAKAVLVHHGWSFDFAHSQIDIVGAIFVLVLTALIVIGIRESASTNNIFVVVKIVALAIFIGFGITLFNAHNLQPFNPVGWLGGPDSDGIPTGIIGAAGLVFFTYIGFDTATTTAEECVNPKRDVPLGVIGSLVIGTVIYCAVAIVLVGAVPWKQVSQDTPLQQAIAPLHNIFANWAIRIGVLAGTSSVALVSLIGQSRIFYAMSRDRMLPRWVAEIHPKFRTPAKMSVITGLFVAFLTLIVPLDLLLSLVNIGTMSAFIVVCAGVLWLRYRRPEIPRSFQVPLPWVTASLGIILSLGLALLGLGALTFISFLIWLAVGLVVYFAYGFRKSDPATLTPTPDTIDP